MPQRKPEITKIRPAGEDHQVVTVESAKGVKGPYRREPCANCPWRVDSVGEFPADAFRHSAETAYDMATHTFGCHDSGSNKPALCAGFLLRGATHNMTVRLRILKGDEFGDVSDGGHPLFDNYRAMAVANGVPLDDESLEQCRD